MILYGARDGAARLRRVLVFNADGDRTGTAKVQQSRCVA